MGHTKVKRKVFNMETGEEEPLESLVKPSEGPSLGPDFSSPTLPGPEPADFGLSLDQVMSVGGLINRAETEWLMELGRRVPSEGSVINLGTLNGLSAAALCAAVGDARVITIDHFNCHADLYEGEPLRTFESVKALDLVPRFVDSESWQIPSGVLRVAAIFIDTNHEARTLRPELNAWFPLLVDGAIVALHDYTKPPFHSYVELIDQTFIPPLWEREGLVDSLIAFRKGSP